MPFTVCCCPILYHCILFLKSSAQITVPLCVRACVCVCIYRQQQGEEDVCGREEAAVQWR